MTDTVQVDVPIEHLEPRAVNALGLLKQVLAAAGQLNRAVITLEKPSPLDPDERDQQILWPAQRAGTVRVV